MNSVDRHFSRYVVLGGLLSALSVIGTQTAWADVSCDVPATLWLKARSGQGILQEAALKPCWAAVSPQTKLTINYRADETAMLNASELQSWMTALGIPSKRIELIENKNASFAIRITVVLGEEKQHGSP